MLTGRLQTGAARALEIEMDASFLLLLMLVLVFADDDGHSLAGKSGLDDVALVVVVEVDADTTGVVNAGRLTVCDGHGRMTQSTGHVPVRHRLPDIRATAATDTCTQPSICV